MSGSKRRTRYKSVDPVTLANRVKAGEVRAVSRLITLLESQEPVGQAALERLNGSQRHAAVIGITGYPGTGKSTLIDQLVTAYRRQGQKVAVVAMDTTSPRTGGALLGDRIRMQDHAVDGGVFIRSMATRGERGGLAPATGGAVRVLEAAGYDVILVETVRGGRTRSRPVVDDAEKPGPQHQVEHVALSGKQLDDLASRPLDERERLLAAHRLKAEPVDGQIRVQPKPQHANLFLPNFPRGSHGLRKISAGASPGTLSSLPSCRASRTARRTARPRGPDPRPAGCRDRSGSPAARPGSPAALWP